MTQGASRREFLRRATRIGALGAAAPLALNLSAIGAASAAGATDYKALVCVFLYGGNDPHNTIVGYDAASHARYARVRGTVAINRAALANTVVTPEGGWPDDRQFALNPALSALMPVFEDGKLALVMNVGTLVQPVTLADYRAQRNLPPKLMSHNDQSTMWQTMMTEGARSGWGGRMADLLASANGSQSSLTSLSVGTSATFSTGLRVNGFAIGANGPTSLNGVRGVAGAELAMQRALLNSSRHLLDAELAARTQRAIQNGSALNAGLAGISAPAMPDTPLGSQLGMVARIIAARQALGMKRQVFLVSLGGFDTHNDLRTRHADLMGQLGGALAAFQSVLDGMGVGRDVTTFTASDFGRTLTVNGDGSDHGWGGHHLVMGGAVRPKAWAGAVPSLRIGAADDIGQGRLLPAVGVDQYGATLARWMGVSPGDMPSVFSNIGNYPTSDLGFLA